MALPLAPPPLRCHPVVVCDVEGTLLRSPSLFPYFMLVAVEAGSFLRGILLLILYPLISLLDPELSIKAMALIAFCGLRAANFHVGATVLHKHLLSDVGRKGFQFLMTGETKICVSRMPRVMVEEFLRRYLGAEMVVAREMKVVHGYFTGFMEEKAADKDLLGDGEDEALGIHADTNSPLHPLFSLCPETVKITEEEKAKWEVLPPSDYPEPLIFHDGRLAFFPTLLPTTAMFIWLPFGCFLAAFRALLFLLLPYGVSTAALALTGMKNRLLKSPQNVAKTSKGRLFICNHRTQVDPLCVSAVLGVKITSLVYGISATTKLLAPVRIVSLRRDKEEDRKIMAAELGRGDVVLCPEGTTCREPYVLRFSPLFAELVDEVFPVALLSYPSMFHGTTVKGMKALDPFVLLANPYVLFSAEFLDAVPAGQSRCRFEATNHAQGAIAGTLGFRSSMLARKNKYRYLAGTDGVYN
ncbi:putative glycerol-3-phosphate acyltransferase 2 [Wolffia australiana]